jgi:hypothetical protein
MPAAVVSGVVCLLVGVAGGVVVGGIAGNPMQEFPAASADEPGSADGEKGEPEGQAKGGGAKGGGAKGGGGGRGGRGPSPKAQLTQLVTKIDQLTAQPLKIDLTSQQKTKMKEILAGLDAKDELSDDDAKAKFDELIKVVEGNKESLEAAGYRWPGTPFQRPGESPPNPFKEGEPATHLKSLQATVGK